jgi:hypothetical protein
VIVDAFTPDAAAVAANQIRGDAAFIQKHQAFRRDRRRLCSPRLTRGDDVGPVLF